MTAFTVRPLPEALRAASSAEHVVAVTATAVWVSPDSPTGADAVATAARPDLAAWASNLDLGARHGLHGRVDTHALLGEPVEVLEMRGSWSRIVLPLQQSHKSPAGYPGWVPTAHLAERVPVAHPVVVRTAPAASGLSVGSVLDLLDDDGSTVVVRTPNRTASLPRAAITDPSVEQHDAGEVLAVARGFTGSVYLWSGASAAGVDCSGLVHIAHRAVGLIVPRDADDQAQVVERMPVGDASDGDLVFYDGPSGVHHVAFVDGAFTTFHAPRTGKLVGPGRSDGTGYPGDEIFAGRVLPS
ncbi:NlpC/P60 family protein [Curtobacterium sp. A7_M15]|uniref:C40 family peptidase n=1 Tax=Curtobacterium sp. A7_M15 TaxID=3065241 RepID=UPI002737B319|nr:NlpC/P60 family protein [Curtobacterium sp. A7_M15]MDP4331964.1 NlpC/P60 family protein [Curtobacterium sp. A7_M15]